MCASLKRNNSNETMTSRASPAATSSTTFKSRIIHFIVLSCFLVSIGWQAHRTRAKSSTLRGRQQNTITNDIVISTSSSIKPLFSRPTTKDRRFKSIFYHAYKHLYQTKNSYSRMLSTTNNNGEAATVEATTAAASTTNGEEANIPHHQQDEHVSSSSPEDLAHELSIEVSYEDTYDTLIFLGVSFIMGEIAYHIGIPPLVGQIIAGFLLGPPLADYVPFPQSMVLLGDLGLILLLVEAGVELDVALVKEAGIRPLLIALAGSIIPFGIGLGVTLAQGDQSIKSAIAAGACFSPTSLGVAANALSGGKALNTPVGQLIVASAVIDDMIGLIILSMLEVLVLDNPPLFSYFIPIISAVGWLILLGVAALTVIPYLVEKVILPRFRPETRPYVAFALLWLLVLAYLPMMYYTKASYLTGAFLAGLAFSQVEGVHHTFVSEAGPVMEWLLRIFFSASIGFQVPIKMFGNKSVIAWGFAFYLSVLGKVPVGLFAPRYNETLPKNYPFNPFTRDVLITSVAMTCRGEFSFIIAAFGIGNGLLDPELYSAIIWAVLLACITSPIILTLLLRHYNRLAEQYLEKQELDSSIVGGRGPLHVNIQIRSSLVPGMQDSIKRYINSIGLFVIDQRSWSPRGLHAIVATEVYAVDSKTLIDVERAVRKLSIPTRDEESLEEAKEDGMNHAHFALELEVITETTPLDDIVANRCREIREHLLSCPELVDAKINVVQWVPMIDAIKKKQGDDLAREAAEALKNKETIDTLVDDTPRYRKVRQKMLSNPISFFQAEKDRNKATERTENIEQHTPEPTELPEVSGTGASEGLRRRPRPRSKMVSSPTVGGSDMWQEDTVAQEAAFSGAAPVVQYDMQAGTMRYGGRRQRMKSDLGAIAENAPAIEERLSGFVRQALDDGSSPFAAPHKHA
jgi:Kef-type K+ transport system membrane component KefB